MAKEFSSTEISTAYRSANRTANLNWLGQPVRMLKRHILSPHDPPMSAKPRVEPGPFTTAQRNRFLIGDAAANIVPYHRHQVPVLKSVVIDEVPGIGQPMGKLHTGWSTTRHPNPSEFSRIPNGDSIRKAETRSHFRAQGARRQDTAPGSGIWLTPVFDETKV